VRDFTPSGANCGKAVLFDDLAVAGGTNPPAIRG
jgi:hypothetical protein